MDIIYMVRYIYNISNRTGSITMPVDSVHSVDQPYGVA